MHCSTRGNRNNTRHKHCSTTSNRLPKRKSTTHWTTTQLQWTSYRRQRIRRKRPRASEPKIIPISISDTAEGRQGPNLLPLDKREGNWTAPSEDPVAVTRGQKGINLPWSSLRSSSPLLRVISTHNQIGRKCFWFFFSLTSILSVSCSSWRTLEVLVLCKQAFARLTCWAPCCECF